MAAVPLTVEFLSDGRCIVCGPPEGLALREQVARRLQASADNGARTPQPSDDTVARGLQPSETGAAFRCPLPYAALRDRPVELRIVLPAGVGRPDDVFPRVEWRQSGHDWIGTATLPSAPSFVSLGHRGDPAGAVADFGWNFYGFFIFAAVFIALYFAWAWWMERRMAAPTS